jgi:hypothetical protein
MVDSEGEATPGRWLAGAPQVRPPGRPDAAVAVREHGRSRGRADALAPRREGRSRTAISTAPAYRTNAPA